MLCKRMRVLMATLLIALFSMASCPGPASAAENGPTASGDRVYIVKPGETLSEIACSFGLSYRAIAAANGLTNPHRIKIGQELIIPGMAMVAASKAGVKPVPGVSRNDVDLLARLIGVESGGQPYEAQVAVGAVVMNRIESKRFPDNLRAVVSQPGQFPPVSRGLVSRHVASSTSRKAALEALAGVDPTNGCLFFNSLSARTAHLAKRPGAKIIGRMVFYH
ncbi:cell wall hydrolase [Desulforudis sp. 1088]|uniref:cell wall hydrolase n=1 Tax=unclassified Candidatus Desulforudis TaxID=2635950 RepID=UPI003484CCF3